MAHDRFLVEATEVPNNFDVREIGINKMISRVANKGRVLRMSWLEYRVNMEF